MPFDRNPSRLRSIFFVGDGWRWGWQLALYIPIVGGIAAILVGPFFWLAMRAGWLPPPMGQGAGWPSVLALIVFRYLVLFAAVLGGTHLAQRWLRRSSLGALGLRLDRGGLRDLLLGGALGALMMVISAGLAAALGWYRPLGFAWRFRSVSIWLPAVVRSLLPQVQAGLLEEVVYRGYLLQVLEKRWNTSVAVVASAFLFALAHLTNPTQDYPTWMVLISITIAGVVFAQAFLLRRNLWLPIGLHFASDGFIVALGAVGRAPEDAVLLATRVSGPALLQGPQSAGLGVFDLIGIGVVALILWQMGRRRRTAPLVERQSTANREHPHEAGRPVA